MEVSWNMTANPKKTHESAGDATRIARRNLYAAHMNLVQLKWNAHDVEGVTDLLKRQIPRPGEDDLRCFEWFYFQNLAHGSSSMLSGTGEEIFSVAASADGQLFAGAGRSAHVFLWNANDLFFRKPLDSHRIGRAFIHSNYNRSLAFSTDGARIASGASISYRNADENVRLEEVCIWNAQTGELMRRFQFDASERTVVQCALSSDGQSVYTISDDGPVRRWSVGDGSELSSISWPEATRLRHVQCSPCGRFVGLSGEVGDPRNERVRIVAAESAEEVSVVDGREFAFDSSGDRIASVVWSEVHQASVIKIWDLLTGRRLLTLQRYAEDSIASVAFSPSTNQVAAAVGNVIQVWDAGTGELEATWKGHRGTMHDLAFSSHGTQLISCGADGGVRLWNLARESDVTALADASDWRTLTAFSASGALVSGHDSVVDANGVSIRDRLRVWDVASGKHIKTIEHPDMRIESAALSRDGKQVAFGSNLLFIHDLTNDDRPPRTVRAVRSIVGLAFSPEAKQVVIFDDGEFRVIDATLGAILRSFPFIPGRGTRYVDSMAFSSDGRLFAAGGNAALFHGDGDWDSPGIVKVWDTRDWSEVLVKIRPLWPHLERDGPSVASVAFSPDSTQIATMDDGLTLVVFDMASGEELFSRRGHRLDDHFSFHHAVVCYEPSGERIVTCSNDLTFWDARTGEELLSIPNVSGSILGFDDSGETLFVGESNRIRKIRAPRDAST